MDGLFLHDALLVGLEAGVVLNGDGVEDAGGLVKDLQTVGVHLVGEDLGRRQRDGHLLVGDGHLGLGQVHTGNDRAVIGHNEALGGKGKLDAVKFVAVFKLPHVGVGVAHGGQLADLLELVLHGDGGENRCFLLPPTAEKAHGKADNGQQHAKNDKFSLLEQGQWGNTPLDLRHSSFLSVIRCSDPTDEWQ